MAVRIYKQFYFNLLNVIIKRFSTLWRDDLTGSEGFTNSAGWVAG